MKSKNIFRERIKEIEDIKDNSGKAPHVASISFKKLRSEVLLHALETEKSMYLQDPHVHRTKTGSQWNIKCDRIK